MSDASCEMDNSLNNPSDNGEDPPPPPPVPMQVDGFQPFHYANCSDEGEEAVPVTNASSAMHARASELTISFEGEVYVFPAVTPEKVPLSLSLFILFKKKFAAKNMFFFLLFFFFKDWFLLEKRNNFISIVVEAWLGVDLVSCLTAQFEIEVFEFSVLNRLREIEKTKLC